MLQGALKMSGKIISLLFLPYLISLSKGDIIAYDCSSPAANLTTIQLTDVGNCVVPEELPEPEGAVV